MTNLPEAVAAYLQSEGAIENKIAPASAPAQFLQTGNSPVMIGTWSTQKGYDIEAHMVMKGDKIYFHLNTLFHSGGRGVDPVTFEFKIA